MSYTTHIKMDVIKSIKSTLLSLQDIPITKYLGTAALGLGVSYWAVNKWNNRNLPPGPWGLPFIGANFRVRKEMHVYCHEAVEKYGNIQSFYLQDKLVVVINGLKLITEALTMEEFSDRPIMNKAYVDLYMDELFFCNSNGNPNYKSDRKLALRSMHSFGKGESSLEEKVRIQTDKVLQKLNDLDGKPVVFQQLIQSFLSCCITSIVCNTNYDLDDPEVDHFIQSCNETIEAWITVKPWPTKMLPLWLSRMFFPGYYKMWSKHRSLKNYIVERMQEHKTSYNPDCLRDVIDAYYKERGINLDIETIANTVMLLIEDNVETLAIFLTWSFFHLIHYTEVQRKCQEEIDQVLGKDTPPTLDHRKDLPYLEATILECQRVCPVFPMGTAHTTQCDTMFHGYKIPSNCCIFPNFYSVHMDKSIFPNPEQFDPGHFLDSNGQVINADKVLIFSIGRRKCIGEATAKVEMFITFSRLLQKFTFQWPGDIPQPSLEYETTGGLTGAVMCYPQPDAFMCAIPR